MNKKFIICLLIMGLILFNGLMGVINSSKNVLAEEKSLKDLINEIFNERIYLLSSKDLDEFDLKLENIKNSISFCFTNSTLLDYSLNELREIYVMAEGYGRFEIVNIVPLIRIYRIDIKENLAISYVQQFILYTVKSKYKEKVNIIKEEWLVPTDENGFWRAATSDYYTIILNKELNWRIKEIIRDDFNNERIPMTSSSRFINPFLNSFPPPPNNTIQLPSYIENEINKYSVKTTYNNYPG